ncbi:hypothetical protein GCM10027059_38860 [Myceligenerans halotolerans]
MSDNLWGQDIEQVRELSRTFERSAQNLESARQLVDGVVFGFDGWGPNVDQMRDLWSSDLAPSLTLAADALRGAGDKAAQNADDQQDTTDSDGGGAFAGATATGSVQAESPFAGVTAEISGEADDGGGVLDWFGDRLDDAGDGIDWLGGQVSDGAGWITDQASDLGDWITDTASDAGDWITDTASDIGDGLADAGSTIGDSFSNLGDAGGLFWDATGGSILDGEWPRTTEVIASGLMLEGAWVDTLITAGTGGMVDLNLFDDGDPYAGEPQPVDENDVTVPHELDDITQSVTDAYQAGDGNVRITTIDTPDGPRVIVSVPGTEPWTPGTGDIPNDLAGNLITAGGGTSSMTEAVELAMQNADIPPGAEVLMVGHSQGGMTVADLLSDSDFVSEYNVTNAITLGAPIDSDHIDPSVSVLEMQHEYDAVPALDMGDGLYNPAAPLIPIPSGSEQAGQNHTEVTFDSPDGVAPYDVLGNHSHEKYTDSIAEATDPNPDNPAYDPAVAAYQQQLIEAGFLGENNDSQTSAVDIQLGRTH